MTRGDYTVKGIRIGLYVSGFNLRNHILILQSRSYKAVLINIFSRVNFAFSMRMTKIYGVVHREVFTKDNCNAFLNGIICKLLVCKAQSSCFSFNSGTQLFYRINLVWDRFYRAIDPCPFLRVYYCQFDETKLLLII